MKVSEAAGDSTYKPKTISTLNGRTTCSFFMPDGKHILYASTHEGGESCPHMPDLRAGGKYLWPIFETYDIYIADLKGNITKQLTDAPGYDAEAVLSPKGDKIVFTSDRSGDLELWIMGNLPLIWDTMAAPFSVPMARNWYSAPADPKLQKKLPNTKTT
ncbi:MAG: hypothetical protein LW693_11210 [Saprospiraceae bacterium]|nr:hypothetical protein [Saprospiraceae bacterium]